MSWRLFKHNFWSAYNRFLWRGLDIDTTFIAHFTRLVHKDFSHSQTSSGTSTRSYSTTAEPTACTEHGAIRKSSAQWVQSVLVVCYTPHYIVEIEITYSKTYSSHLVVTRAMVNILVYFNSTLNPFFFTAGSLVKWGKQWSRQSDKHFGVHGVRPSSSYTWSYKYF